MKVLEEAYSQHPKSGHGNTVTIQKLDKTNSVIKMVVPFLFRTICPNSLMHFITGPVIKPFFDDRTSQMSKWLYAL
jgi:hypothetical protein